MQIIRICFCRMMNTKSDWFISETSELSWFWCQSNKFQSRLSHLPIKQKFTAKVVDLFSINMLMIKSRQMLSLNKQTCRQCWSFYDLRNAKFNKQILLRFDSLRCCMQLTLLHMTRDNGKQCYFKRESNILYLFEIFLSLNAKRGEKINKKFSLEIFSTLISGSLSLCVSVCFSKNEVLYCHGSKNRS